MKIKFFFLLASILLTTSCYTNDEPTINPDNLLIGNWVQPKYEDNNLTFLRASTLLKDSYGFAFKENQQCVERTSGWCGTPPIIFTDMIGFWKIKKDILEISIGVKNDNNTPNPTYSYKIISLSNKKLVLKIHISQQQKEHQKLMKMYDEIVRLSQSITCTNANDWKYTAYGAKACGGSQGFIAYSKQINTTDFLNKVAIYTQAEKDYNIKWGIVSTCDIPQEPTSIECKNGFPVLKY